LTLCPKGRCKGINFYEISKMSIGTIFPRFIMLQLLNNTSKNYILNKYRHTSLVFFKNRDPPLQDYEK